MGDREIERGRERGQREGEEQRGGGAERKGWNRENW